VGLTDDDIGSVGISRQTDFSHSNS
jgi:hypothetical protein